MIVFECDLHYLSIHLSIYLFPWLAWLNHTMESFGTTKKSCYGKNHTMEIHVSEGIVVLLKMQEYNVDRLSSYRYCTCKQIKICSKL